MKNLTIVEYQAQRVLTTAQLAQAYECDVQIISNNFKRNENRFEEGKHYFKLTGSALKDFKGIHQNDESLKFVSQLYLWTKRGASRHCKMLGTDKAWEMFDILEENYFNPKPAVTAPAADVYAPAPYVLIPKFFRGKQVITIKDAAAILSVSRALIEDVINKPTANLHEGQDYYRLKGDKRAEFKRENPSISASVHHIIAILKSGFEKICDYLKVKEVPEIFRVENLAVELGLMPKEFLPQPPVQSLQPPQKSELETARENIITAQKLISKFYSIWPKTSTRDREALGRVMNILELLAIEKSIYLEASEQ